MKIAGRKHGVRRIGYYCTCGQVGIEAGLGPENIGVIRQLAYRPRLDGFSELRVLQSVSRILFALANRVLHFVFNGFPSRCLTKRKYAGIRLHGRRRIGIFCSLWPPLTITSIDSNTSSGTLSGVKSAPSSLRT